MQQVNQRDIQKAAKLSTLMQAVGFAVWQVQSLEDTAASYLVIRVRGKKGIGAEKGEALLQDAQGLTFGMLVGELTRAGVLDEGLAGQLDRIVKERNWLVHRARRETRGVLSNDTLYDALLGRAERLGQDAEALLKQLSDACLAFVVASGISRAQLDQAADKIARAWGLR